MRECAIAALMLDEVDQEAWQERGLSRGDVLFASTLGAHVLRFISIELGFKHIINTKMKRPIPQSYGRK